MKTLQSKLQYSQILKIFFFFLLIIPTLSLNSQGLTNNGSILSVSNAA